MDAMLKAIKQKRGGVIGGLMKDEGKLDLAEEGTKVDLDAILDTLSEDDKMLLMEKLGAPKAEGASQKLPIEQGGMSQGEKLAVDNKIIEDDEDDVEEAEDDVDSDEIALGMVGNRFKGVDDGNKPSNLSQRVQMEMAKKLKAKGKI